MRLLLVEDDPYDAQLVQRAIRKARLPNPVRLVTDRAAAIATGFPFFFCTSLVGDLETVFIDDLRYRRCLQAGEYLFGIGHF